MDANEIFNKLKQWKHLPKYKVYTLLRAYTGWEDQAVRGVVDTFFASKKNNKNKKSAKVSSDGKILASS